MVVDPVSEGSFGGQTLGSLERRDDGAEMGDDDDVGGQVLQAVERGPGADGQAFQLSPPGGAMSPGLSQNARI